MFDTVLVANRGEIAVRIFRTLRKLGIRSVAVYSDADAGSLHVREADVAVRLGPAPAAESYLHIERILTAAAETGAQAIHPGYGFLAENADFAQAVAAAGLTFIGPPVRAIEVMGDKIRAKQSVIAAGVPVVPGRTDLAMTDDDLVAAAAEVGFPVLVKPSAGGGGKGMHLVTDPADLPGALVSARREAALSFGDDTLFLERYVLSPRHIEVQVLADNHGNVIHLGERECSLQRRHQKVIEEAPSPVIDAETRERLGAAAIETARSVGYSGVGTVEFISPGDSPGEFFFMEMNTRLQVEHPVTEMITGVDLVEQQLLTAAGEKLPLSQADIRLNGHAVEARVYAEDADRGFLPTGGTALVVREPHGNGVRVDTSLLEGGVVGTTYDPMLAKVIAWAPDRTAALAKLDTALADMVILGVTTNTSFLRRLITDDEVRAGALDTGLIERRLGDFTGRVTPVGVFVGWALHQLLRLTPAGAIVDPWSVPSGWRVGGAVATRWRLAVTGSDEPVTVAVQSTLQQATVTIGEQAFTASAAASPGGLLLTVDGRTEQMRLLADGTTTWVTHDGETYSLRQLPPERRRGASANASAEVRSPMPGSVVAVHVSAGETVAKGTPLIVVEAMKMEHTLVAPSDGIVGELLARTGDQVKVDQPLLSVIPEETP